MTSMRIALPSDVRNLHGQLHRLFAPLYTRENESGEEMFAGTWLPPVDIAEERERLTVRAEVAGVRREDIQIEFNEGVLTIRGERRFEKPADEVNFHRVERTYGSFSRSFSLPRTVDAEKINARYEDGVLEITIPKREEAKPRQIRISVVNEPRQQ